VYSQEKIKTEVPAVVEKAFMKAFPNTKNKMGKKKMANKAGFKYIREMSVLYMHRAFGKKKK
jgi:hypothetical protein